VPQGLAYATIAGAIEAIGEEHVFHTVFDAVEDSRGRVGG